MQVKVNGHFNWVSDVTQVMTENNIKEMNVSNYGISYKLKDKFKSDLLERIKSYGEGKKLRTYALYEQVIKYEPYLSLIKKTKNRIMLPLSKFRLSSHDLEIKRGRYSNKSVKAKERYCKLCKLNNTLMVEDEFHFSIMVCLLLYKTRRDSMMRKISAYLPSFKEVL